jgi:hypothetical protein
MYEIRRADVSVLRGLAVEKGRYLAGERHESVEFQCQSCCPAGHVDVDIEEAFRIRTAESRGGGRWQVAGRWQDDESDESSATRSQDRD